MNTTAENHPPHVAPPDRPASRYLPAIDWFGYLLLALSFTLYVLGDLNYSTARALEIFFVHYGLAVIYTFVLLSQGRLGVRRSWQADNLPYTIMLLHLYFISCFALNRQLPVFENSVDWFTTYLIVTAVVMLSLRFSARLPRVLQYVQYTVVGSALLLYTYQLLYVLPFFPMGFFGALALGIGAHIFVPAFLLIAAIAAITQHVRALGRRVLYPVGLGVVLSLAVIITYVSVWSIRIREVTRYTQLSVLDTDRTGLPIWLRIAQTLPNDALSVRILKGHHIYSSPQRKFASWDFMPTTVNWDEVRRHDPLVFLAQFTGYLDLPSEECVRILQTMTGRHHRAEERLWSGQHLRTSFIVTDVDIFPDLRLAYTEHYLSIHNDNPRTWRSQEEALYTFHVPEGSVVTSLSLWINGREEKGILTSRGKATKAYQTIVGVESRDPSVVHWQEGNTVTVRVFPCTNEVPRKVKIGITSPLPVRDGRVWYEPLRIEGPTTDDAETASRITFVSPADHINLPDGFVKSTPGNFRAEGVPYEALTVSFDARPVNTSTAFVFEGQAYSVQPQAFRPVATPVAHLFLDINRHWTRAEVDQLMALQPAKSVYAALNGELVRLDDGNTDLLTPMLAQNFSMFPFHLLRGKTDVLVVTKGDVGSPRLMEIQGSPYAEREARFLQTVPPVPVCNLGAGTSTYMATLRELREIHYVQAPLAQLLDWLKAGQFPESVESDQSVVLHDAQLAITRRPADGVANTAPDHLFRLYTYNNIMRQAGPHYFSRDWTSDALVEEAHQAYVVSPVSSLVVLESKADYERFGIHDNGKSVGNAAKNGSGEVPEPHEWILIGLFVGLLVYLRFRQRA